jgi:YhcH/YjgK/YiaL family protein
MILDRLENLKDYVALNPHFAKVVDFLSKNDLAGLPLGRNVIDGDHVYANVMEIKPKSQEEARLEVHRRYIDIQIPLTADERMGYSPLCELPEIEFVEADDAALYPVGTLARDYFNVRMGEFVVFFPQDAHAPAITGKPMKKVVIKVAVE